MDIKLDGTDSEIASTSAKRTEPQTLIEKLIAKHINIGLSGSLEEEMAIFSQKKEIPSCVLTFWRQNESSYPKMSAVAKVILGVPATTAKSESAFSIAGCLLQRRRASIEPMRAEKILFIHDNYDLLNF
jgi:hypothetical protein